MKQIVSVLVLMFVTSLALAGGNVKWKGFDEGMAEAKRTNKKVLIDVYTNWCGWCKKMDAVTYADKNVADYLAKKYIVIKLNAESSKPLTYKSKQYTESELAAAFGISGYPATLFLKPDGEAITMYPGFADAKKFLTVVSFIAEDHYLSRKFEDYASSRE